ncbi:MAG: hypothetical protein ACC644_04290, partial [Candidatus Hydrothermarchaeales archaeon]
CYYKESIGFLQCNVIGAAEKIKWKSFCLFSSVLPLLDRKFFHHANYLVRGGVRLSISICCRSNPIVFKEKKRICLNPTYIRINIVIMRSFWPQGGRLATNENRLMRKASIFRYIVPLRNMRRIKNTPNKRMTGVGTPPI